jgi:hypothetical protein
MSHANADVRITLDGHTAPLNLDRWITENARELEPPTGPATQSSGNYAQISAVGAASGRPGCLKGCHGRKT